MHLHGWIRFVNIDAESLLSIPQGSLQNCYRPALLSVASMSIRFFQISSRSLHSREVGQQQNPWHSLWFVSRHFFEIFECHERSQDRNHSLRLTIEVNEQRKVMEATDLGQGEMLAMPLVLTQFLCDLWIFLRASCKFSLGISVLKTDKSSINLPQESPRGRGG
jgi:hypothetical protein